MVQIFLKIVLNLLGSLRNGSLVGTGRLIMKMLRFRIFFRFPDFFGFKDVLNCIQ